MSGPAAATVKTVPRAAHRVRGAAVDVEGGGEAGRARQVGGRAGVHACSQGGRGAVHVQH